MRHFLTLLHMHWRGTRGLCSLLAIAAALALIACDATWPARETVRWNGGVPVIGVAVLLGTIATIAAVIASSVFATGHDADAAHPLASLPIGASRVFFAKLAYAIVATVGIVCAACVVTTIVIAAMRGGEAISEFLGDARAALPWSAAVCVPALFVVTCATLGMRGLAALFAGAILPATLAFFARRLNLDSFGFIVRPEHVAWGCAIVALAACASAWTSFGRGFTRVSTLGRRAVVAFALIVVPITSVAGAGAIALRELSLAEPGDHGVRLEVCSLSPDERFALVQANVHPYCVATTWVVDLESAHVAVLPGVEHHLATPTGWNSDGTLSLTYAKQTFFAPRSPSEFAARFEWSSRATFDASTGDILGDEGKPTPLPMEWWREREPHFERTLVRRDGCVDVVDIASGRVERSIATPRFESVSFPSARRQSRFALHLRRDVSSVIDLDDGSERAIDAACRPGWHGDRIAFLSDGRTLLVDAQESLCMRERDGMLRVIVRAAPTFREFEQHP